MSEFGLDITIIRITNREKFQQNKWNMNAPKNGHSIFFLMWPWYLSWPWKMTLTLILKETALPQGIHMHNMISINSLPDDKILDWSKRKQMADDILKCI